MSVEITVQIFPNPGAGIQTMQSSRGEVMHVPVPFINYQKVRDILFRDKDTISFLTRTGEEISTNMPYLVVRKTEPEGNA